MSDVEQLQRTVEELVGEALRAVIGFDRDSFTLAYCREDLDPRAVREGFETSRDEFIIRQMRLDDDATPDLVPDQQAEDTGETPCVSYWTEESIVFQLPDGRYSGIVVSIEHDTDVAVGELCSALGKSLAPA